MPTRLELFKERQIARERFMKARIAERGYARNLASVGRHIGAIVNGFSTRGIVDDFDAMKKSLFDYSRLLNPWAKAVSSRMQAEVSHRDIKAWTQLSRSIGSGLAKEIAKTPTGDIHRALLADQVKLITSLPIEAAERVHKLTNENLISGDRADQVAKEIMRSGQVSAYSAMRIARTETSRTASVLTEARSIYIGSEGYWWRTAQDTDVRPLHVALEGKFFKWGEPPVTGSNGERSNPGCIYFCRCWPEPALPDRIR